MCVKRSQWDDALGRLTIHGNVENWRSGSSGDHGLEATSPVSSGVPTAEIVANALAQMGIASTPGKSQHSCRQYRWGNSYLLRFDTATNLVLQHEDDGLCVANNPSHFSSQIRKTYPQGEMKEHPGGSF